MSRSRKFRPLVALVAVHLLLLLIAVWSRPVDGDEGYYCLASRLVAEGETPYADFFYPQAPLLPYLYAPFARFAPASLTLLRLVSVAAAVGMAWLWLVWLVRRRDLDLLPAAATLLLVAASPHLVLWSVTVKTFAAANLLVTASLVTIAIGLDTRNPGRWLLGGGAAFGLAVGVRLLYAPAAAALIAGLLLWPAPRPRAERWRAARAAAVGLVLGALPTVLFWLAAPDRFLFNNLGYHLARFSPHGDAGWPVRLGAAVRILAETVITNPFLLVTVLLAVWGAVSWRRAAAPVVVAFERLSLLVAGVYTATCLFPDPTYNQYFTGALAPLLLPAAAGGLSRLPGPRRSLVGVTAAVLVVAAVVAFAVQKPGVRTERHWRLDHYASVSRTVAELTRPDDVVLAFWPGYVFESDRQPYPATENHFAVGVSEQLTPRERARYHVPGKQELERAFAGEIPSLVVVGTWMHDIDQALDNEEMRHLLDVFTRHYVVVDTVGAVKLCRPKRRPVGGDASP